MDLIPHELLQLIANSLLPRYQCRLALASKHHYRYLYTDLLRWHARKDVLSVPRYKWVNRRCGNKQLSLLESNKQIVMYTIILYTRELLVHNLTHLYSSSDVSPAKDVLDSISMADILHAVLELDLNILTGCYKYMHKMPLLMCNDIQHKLISLPLPIIIYNIMGLLDLQDKRNLVRTNSYFANLFKYQYNIIGTEPLE